MIALVLGLGACAATGGEPDLSPYLRLEPGEMVELVQRSEPMDLGSDIGWEAPAVVWTAGSGVEEVVIAATHWVDGRERIEVWRGPDSLQLSGPSVLFDGARAFGVRLAAGADGVVWATWCGTETTPQRGTHSRSVYLQALVEGADPEVVSEATWACAPDVAVGYKSVHVVWEAQTEAGIGIMHRSSFGGRWAAPLRLSTAAFARRPSIDVHRGKVAVAWDAWADEGARYSPDLDSPVDPDVNVVLRELVGGVWSAPIRVAAEKGIQAAPRVVITDEGTLVAYHASVAGGLVKWPRIRRFNGVIQELSAPDPGWTVTPTGEQQGAEFPDLAVLPDGQMVMVSRMSHGAAVHVASAAGVTHGLDLTRSPWGARGVAASITSTKAGEVLAVRRGRKRLTVERLQVAPGGAPAFQDLSPEQVNPGPLRPPPVRTVGERRIIYGDVHMHSAISDGTGPADEIYARAFVRGLEFAVLTDHDYIVGSRLIPSEHDEIAWITDRFNALDGFATLHAYEWTTPGVPKGSGHQIVYFRGAAPVEVFGYKDVAPDTSALNRALADERAFTAPHHTSWTGTDWDQYDPAIQRQFELVSVHGLSERVGDQRLPSRGEHEDGFAVDGLKKGHRFGFIAGSDGHGLLWHHGQGRRRDPWVQGLSGVVVDRLDREALFDAMYARRTFATTGPPMRVHTSLEATTLKWDTLGTRELVSVTLVSDGVDVKTLAVTGRNAHGSWTVEPNAKSHYIRVEQTSSDDVPDLAWSSPVFAPSAPVSP